MRQKKWFIASDRHFIHPGIYPATSALVAKFATVYTLYASLIYCAINKARYIFNYIYICSLILLSGCIHQAFWTDFTFWRFAKPCRILWNISAKEQYQPSLCRDKIYVESWSLPHINSTASQRTKHSKSCNGCPISLSIGRYVCDCHEFRSQCQYFMSWYIRCCTSVWHDMTNNNKNWTSSKIDPNF